VSRPPRGESGPPISMMEAQLEVWPLFGKQERSEARIEGAVLRETFNQLRENRRAHDGRMATSKAETGYVSISAVSDGKVAPNAVACERPS
jgi:hypothetical protein